MDRGPVSVHIIYVGLKLPTVEPSISSTDKNEISESKLF